MKRTLLVVLAVAIFTQSSMVVAISPYLEALECLNELGVITKDMTNAEPSDTITRAQFVTLIVRALGMTEESLRAEQSNFVDVPKTHQYFGYIAVAHELGIIGGYDEKNFAPNNHIKFEEAAKVLVSALGYSEEAQKLGGYPTGYLMVANKERITRNAAMCADEAVTVAVSAQLIFNALEIPMIIEGVRMDGRVGAALTTFLIKIDPDSAPPPPSMKPQSDTMWNSRLLTKGNDDRWQFNTVNVDGKDWNLGQFDFSYVGYKKGETVGMTNIPDNSITIDVRDGEDVTEKLNEAINAIGEKGGGTVNIPSGSFFIGTDSATVNINHSNVLIKGRGMGATRLHIPDSFSPGSYWDVGAVNWNGNPSWNSAPEITTVTSGTILPLGTKTVPVESADTINEGDYIVVRQILWREFVRKHAYDTSLAPLSYRWSNYDDDDLPLFASPSFSFAYYRKVTAKDGNVLTLDIPLPYELNTANTKISILRPSGQLFNCGMEGITFTADANAEAVPDFTSTGTTLLIKGLVDGWFKNVEIQSFNSLAFSTLFSVGVTFESCIASNARNRGGGGNGYGFYMRGQNMLYKNCYSSYVRHAFIAANSRTCNIVVTGCVTEELGINPDITTGSEAVDDTHQEYTHGILYDNHYSNHAGLLMVNRGTLSTNAYQTNGWAVIWNHYNTGKNEPDMHGRTLHRDVLAISPGDFAFVIGASEGTRVFDGYFRYGVFHQGTQVTRPELHVGEAKLPSGKLTKNVLYEGTGVSGLNPASLYEVMLEERLAETEMQQ